MRAPKIILGLLLALGFSSCEEKYISSIPDMPVYLTVDLNVHNTFRNSNYKAMIFERNNTLQSGHAVGFGGILLYTTYEGKYVAWDLACPYEVDAKTKVELVQENEKDFVYHTTCPVCGSKYELMYGIGNPVSGPSKEILRPYKVSRSSNMSGEILTIYR